MIAIDAEEYVNYVDVKTEVVDEVEVNQPDSEFIDANEITGDLHEEGIAENDAENDTEIEGNFAEYDENLVS